MAFFGVDGLEHQLKHLKAQLSSKDFEITSIRNELRKKDEDLNDIRRSKEAAEYKVQEEAERAHKAEMVLKQRTTEMNNLRLQHDNLQATLRSANDKLKAGEKENRGLQYDNESLGHSSAEAKRIAEEKEALVSKVKDLEKRLAYSEDTVKSLRSANPDQPLKRSKTDFFGSSLSPVPTKRGTGSRRRSTSLSSDNRMTELQAELDQLRPSVAELEKVRTQLGNVKKELDKVTNAKLVLERNGKRELDELKSQIDDLNYELGEWRRDDGSGTKAEVEKVRKALASDMEVLRARLSELEKDLHNKVHEIERLTARVDELQAVESELEIQKAKVKELQCNSSATDVSSLNAKIISLETALELAKSAASATSSHAASASSDLTTRQLQRELKSLRAEVERQNDELANQDEEINRLMKQSASRIPLPGSPVLGASRRQEDEARIRELGEEIESVKGQVDVLTQDRKTAESALRASQKSAEDATAMREVIEARLSDATTALQAKEARITELEADLQQIRKAAEEQQGKTQALETAKGSAESRCQELQQQLDELSIRSRDMMESAAAQSHDADAVRAMSEELDGKQRRVASLEQEIVACRAQISNLEQAAKEVAVERETATEQVAERQVEISTLMDRLVEAEDRFKTALSDKKTAVKNVKEKHREAQTEASALKLRLEDAQKEVEEGQIRTEEMQERLEEMIKAKLETENALNELKEEISNRSTESDARQRDEDLFDHKEAVSELQSTLEKERDEHAEEMRLATFILAKDLEEARSHVAELEKELQVSSKAVGHLRLAEDKIQRLRAERDDLRISLNFVNHEQRFTSQAADSLRQALDSVRIQLDEKNALFGSLQNEYTEVAARFGQVSAQLENDLKTATTDRDELVGRVSLMEEKLEASMANHRLQAEESQSLVSELALARSKASRAEAELLNLRCANKQLEIRHDRVHAILEAKREAEAKIEAEGLDESTSTSASDERSASHRRRRSGLFGPSIDILESLKVEKADLLGRISRRDARIQHLENEVKQVKVNLHLAQESIAESETEREDLESRFGLVQADLNVKSTEIASVRASLAEAEASLEESRTALALVESKAVYLERELDAATSDVRVQERSLQEVIIALAAQHQTAHLAQKTWAVRENSLMSADAAVDRIQVAVSTALGSARDQIVGLSAQLTELESQVAKTSGELEAARQTEATLRQQVVDRETLHVTIANLESDNQDLRQKVEQVHVLEEELAEGKRQLQLRQTDIEELLIKLASAEKSTGVGEKDAEILAEKTKALNDAFAEKDALLESLSEVQQELDTVQAALDEATAERTRAQQDAERLAADFTTLEAGTEENVRLLRESQDRIQSLESDLAQGRGALEQATQDLESRQSNVEVLEAKLRESECLRAEVGRLSDALEEERSSREQLQASLALSTEETHAMVRERDDLSVRLDSTHQELDTARNAVSDLQDEAVKRSADLVRIEQTLKEARVALHDTENALATAKYRSDELSAQLSSVGEEKADLEARLVKMNAAIDELSVYKTQADEMRGQIERLESQLAAKGTEAANPETQDLKDRIVELEASLSLKVQEVDEADDKVKEVYKEKVKLEKKIAKLQRQLAAVSASANTAANKAISMGPPAENRQAPVSRSTPLPNFNHKTTATVPPSPRQPLRSVTVFAEKALSPGLKRARDEKIDETKGGVDMILLPPTQLEQAKSTPRVIKSLRTFGENAAPKEKINVFSE